MKKLLLTVLLCYSATACAECYIPPMSWFGPDGPEKQAFEAKRRKAILRDCRKQEEAREHQRRMKRAVAQYKEPPVHHVNRVEQAVSGYGAVLLTKAWMGR